MMGRSGLFAVIAIVELTLGWCADHPSTERRNAAAAPEVTRSPPAPEPTAGGGGRRSEESGEKRGETPAEAP